MTFKKKMFPPELCRRFYKHERFSDGHGVYQELGHLGLASIYYTLPYMLRAKTCVCLGSGDGFVPRLMRQAQIDMGLEDSETILIDAGYLSDSEWKNPKGYTARNFPGITIVQKRTEYAISLFKDKTIDYLHIDAYHGYSEGKGYKGGVRYDFHTYEKFMTPTYHYITLHDYLTESDEYIPQYGVNKLGLEIEKAGKHEMLRIPWSCGVLIVRQKDSEEP